MIMPLALESSSSDSGQNCNGIFKLSMNMSCILNLKPQEKIHSTPLFNTHPQGNG